MDGDRVPFCSSGRVGRISAEWGHPPGFTKQVASKAKALSLSPLAAFDLNIRTVLKGVPELSRSELTSLLV